MSWLNRRLIARRLIELGKAAVPPPPRGLAERIKAEIPTELAPPRPDAEPPPARRPTWHPHRWRLAAALVMTVAAGTLFWWLRREGDVFPPPAGERAATEAAAPTADPGSGLATREAPALAAPAAPRPQPRAGVDEGRAEIAPPATAVGEIGAGGRPPAPERRPLALEVEPELPAMVGEEVVAMSREGDAEAEALEDRRDRREPALDSAPATAFRQPPADEPDRRLEEVTPAQAVGGPAARKVARDEPALAARAGTPGFAAGADALALARRHLEAGRWPPTGAVCAADLVAAFAHLGPIPVNGEDVAIAADGVRAPGTAGGRTWLLRFHLRGSVAVVAGQPASHLDVRFDSERVERLRRLGSEEDLAGVVLRDELAVDAPALARGVTLLYRAELRAADVGGERPLATLTLRYRPPAGGETTAGRELSAADLAASWDEAARDLRLAVVAAEFGAALERSDRADAAALADLARRAHDLADDDIAHEPPVSELARLAALAAELAAK